MTSGGTCPCMTSMPDVSPASMRYPHSTRRAETRTSTTPFAIASGSRPTHAAGIVHNASRSRIARRSTMASRTSASVPGRSSSSGMSGFCFDPVRTTFPQLKQKFVGWNKERVGLENATDYDHGMRSHDVHHDAGAKLGAIVRSYDGIFIAWEHVIEAGLVFHQIVNARHIFQRPLHVGHQARYFISLLRARLKYLFDEGQHSILREVPIAKVRLVPITNLELSLLHSRVNLNACLT